MEVLRSALRVGIVVTVVISVVYLLVIKQNGVFIQIVFCCCFFLLLDIGQTYRAYSYEQLLAYSQGTGSCVTVWWGDNINARKSLISSLLFNIDRKNYAFSQRRILYSFKLYDRRGIFVLPGQGRINDIGQTKCIMRILTLLRMR